MIDVKLNKLKSLYSLMATLHQNVQKKMNEGMPENEAILSTARNIGLTEATVATAFELIQLSDY